MARRELQYASAARTTSGSTPAVAGVRWDHQQGEQVDAGEGVPAAPVLLESGAHDVGCRQQRTVGSVATAPAQAHDGGIRAAVGEEVADRQAHRDWHSRGRVGTGCVKVTCG